MNNDDLISRSALKKALKSNCDTLCPDKNTNWCEHCCPLNDFEDLIDNAPTVHHPNCDNCEDKAKQYSLGFQDGYMTGKERSQVIDNCDMNVFEPEKYMKGGAE